MFTTVVAVWVFKRICDRFLRRYPGGTMRDSLVVNKTKYCWSTIHRRSTPEATNVAIVRWSSQAHSVPAKVRTITKDVRAPVLRMNPAQSIDMSFLVAVVSEETGGLTEGR